MAIKVGINGFGRIGRMVFRAAVQNFNDIEIVGINDLLEPDYLAYMLKYDSVHGRFKGEVSVDGNNLIVNGKKIRLTQERDPAALKWNEVHADVVIEAIFENLDAKQQLMREIEPKLKPGALFATNTSSLKIEDIASALHVPGRLIGVHFFNPVAQMPLVEVVGTAATDPQMLHRGLAFVRLIDKLPLPVKSAPGFLVNAVLGPYLREAMRAADEGFTPDTIDRAATDFGMPMGPLELADTVGLDIALAAGRALTGGAEAPQGLMARVAAGQLGKKTGQGYYTWQNGRPKKQGAPEAAGLALRLIAPLLAATQRVIDQGVVTDADLADAGVIFGTGFAPRTGGPSQIAANRGSCNASVGALPSSGT